MAIVDLDTELAAPAHAVWRAVKTPRAFRTVTRSVLTMPAIKHREDEWRESGGLIRRWNHDIIVVAAGDSRCNYRDRIDIDAGIFTPAVVLYARWFYRARQHRWRALARVLTVEGPK